MVQNAFKLHSADDSPNEGMTTGQLGVFRIYYEIVMVYNLKL